MPWVPEVLQNTTTTVFVGVKDGVHVVTEATDYLDLPELSIKVTYAALYALSLIPGASVLYMTVEVLKESKNLIGYIKGIKSADGLMNDKVKTWHSTMYNVAGVVLTFFTTLDYIKKFTHTATAVHQFFAKLPLGSVLAFAGILDGIVVGILAYDLYENVIKYQKLKQSDKACHAKIDFWTKGVDESQIELRLESYSARMLALDFRDEEKLEKLAEKKRKWSALNELLKSNPESVNKYSAAELQKWQLKEHKVELEKTYTMISSASKVFKISSTLFTTGLLISGVGAVAMPFIKAATNIIDVIPSVVTHFMKRKINNIHIEKVPMAAAAA